MKWDLVQLYSQLDLQPDCTLEEFRRAYWRRIAELHPDKGTDAATSEVRLLLPELIWLYATATRFHRRYGRLPGAAPLRDTGRGQQPKAKNARSCAAGPPTDILPAISVIPASSAVDEDPSRRSLVLAVLLLATLLILALAWDWPMPGRRGGSRPTIAHVEPSMEAVAMAAGQLKVGMDETTVLAIQGKPLQMSENHWDYGPSWLEFEEGHLVDWHSSPLRQLRTATPSPVPEPAHFAE